MNWKKGVIEKCILVDHLLHPLTFILFFLSFFLLLLPLSLHWNESHFWSSESLLFFFLFITILNPFSFHLISLIKKEKKMKERRQGVEKRSFDLQHIFSFIFSSSFFLSFFCLFLFLASRSFFLFPCHSTYTVVSFWNLVLFNPNLSLFIFCFLLSKDREENETGKRKNEREKKERKRERRETICFNPCFWGRWLSEDHV